MVEVPDGDLVFRTVDGVEPLFDLIAVVAGSTLELPATGRRSVCIAVQLRAGVLTNP